MEHQWQRFMYWIEYADDYGSALQGISSVVMLIITILLFRRTSESMKAAVDSARASEAAASASRRHLEMTLHPNIELSLVEMAWQNMSIGEQFSVTAVIRNHGSFTTRINKAIVSWQDEEDSTVKDKRLPIRNVIVAPGKDYKERLVLFAKVEYTIQFEPAFCDFITLTVECSDLGSINTCTFSFSIAEKLRHWNGPIEG